MLFRLVSLPFLALLLLTSLRRLIFTLTVLFVRPRSHAANAGQAGLRTNTQPDVLVLVACRDEENVIAGLCDALERLDYPAEGLRIVLIDDGSFDYTRWIMEKYAQGKPNWSVLALPDNRGKAAALNAALS